MLTEDAAWAPAGHEIAFGQYVIPASQAEANTAEDAADATVTVGRWNVGLRNNQAEVILSRTQGGIVSWVHNGTEHVIRPRSSPPSGPDRQRPRRRTRFRTRPVDRCRPLRPLR